MPKPLNRMIRLFWILYSKFPEKLCFDDGSQKSLEIREQKINLFKKAKTDLFLCRDLEMKTHLLSLLKRNDKMSMANSVELRSAFLDTELLYWMDDFSKLGTDYTQKKLLNDCSKISL